MQLKEACERLGKIAILSSLTQPELEEEFIQYCKKEDIVGIKGHRTAGGFRGSS